MPQTDTLNELSDVRAQALAGFGWGDPEKMRADFANRDRTLQDFRKHQDVVLWFEHDLYDQLQLLQLLDWFEQQDLEGINLDLVQIDSYPGVRPFYGLGQLSGPQLARLFPMRKRVTHAQRSIATEAWRAFRAEDPTDLAAIAQQKFDEMPFLAAALRAFLKSIHGPAMGFPALSASYCRRRQQASARSRKFILSRASRKMCPGATCQFICGSRGSTAGPNPALIESPKNEFTITDAGRQLLEGKADWIKLQGGVDRWLGGVHLAAISPSGDGTVRKKTLVGN